MKQYQTKHQRASLRMDDYPYKVQLSETHVRAEHINWLDEKFPGGYNSRWTFVGPYQISFRDEQERLLFVLRWA